MTTTTTEHDPWIGHTLAGRYRVVRLLGEGGIGCVYVAQHLTLGRNVALKVLRDHFAATSSLRQRFTREARALSRLSHPNVVSVVDFGSTDDSLFLVMELIDGETLAQRIRRDPPDVRSALEIMRQILRALAYAHGLGIVHRDLKPGNVLVRKLPDKSEHVTVLDFGLAKFLDEESSAALTRQGVILGTPAYMSPEQAMGERATATADVYAAALVLFELLAHQRPFAGGDPGALLKAHLLSPIPRLSDVRPELRVSAELEAVLRVGLDKKTSGRFPDAGAMLDALDAVPELARRLGSRPEHAKAPSDRQCLAPGPARPDPASFVLGSPAEPSSAALESSHATAADGALAPGVHQRPRRRALFAAAAGLLGVAAVATLLVRANTAQTAAATSARAPAAAPSSPPEPASPVPPPTASAGPAARNPWTEPVPAELATLHAAIERGAQPSRAALQVLYRYGAAHRSDARGLLLLGHTYRSRGWDADALDAYRDAYARDPASRGDPRMLADLVAIAEMQRHHRRATAYIARWFGQEALPYVAAQAAQTSDPKTKARLEHLRTALANALPGGGSAWTPDRSP